MAVRPVFMPRLEGASGVTVAEVSFTWVPGMAPAQRRKCAASLQEAVREAWPRLKALEISSKSGERLGVRLSAFNLGFESRRSGGFVCVESVYQCSKVFAAAGPFPEGYRLNAAEARALVAEHADQPLQAFELHGERWPLLPRRAFYNWVYCHALRANPRLVQEVLRYSCFTDIEFNPSRSVNCQAYAVALYVSLTACGQLEQALSGRDAFLAVHPPDDPPPLPRRKATSGSQQTKTATGRSGKKAARKSGGKSASLSNSASSHVANLLCLPES